MENFDEKVNSYLEEGILDRATQRIKNVGRRISHPFNRAFGSGEKQKAASLTTPSGYKKHSMTIDMLKNTISDLVKLNALNGDVGEITEYLLDGLFQGGYFNVEDEDHSKLAQTLEREREEERANLRKDRFTRRKNRFDED